MNWIPSPPQMITLTGFFIISMTLLNCRNQRVSAEETSGNAAQGSQVPLFPYKCGTGGWNTYHNQSQNTMARAGGTQPATCVWLQL